MQASSFGATESPAAVVSPGTAVHTNNVREVDWHRTFCTAQLAKRAHKFARACKLWESVRGNSREGYEAYEQLAIYYEHEARNAHLALAITRDALAQTASLPSVGNDRGRPIPRKQAPV
jgi:hypothetical protein